MKDLKQLLVNEARISNLVEGKDFSKLMHYDRIYILIPTEFQLESEGFLKSMIIGANKIDDITMHFEMLSDDQLNALWKLKPQQFKLFKSTDNPEFEDDNFGNIPVYRFK